MNPARTLFRDNFYIKFNFENNIEYFQSKIFNYRKNLNKLEYDDILSDFNSKELNQIKKEEEFGFINDKFKVNFDNLLLYKYDSKTNKYIKSFEPSERTFDFGFYKEDFGEILVNFLNTNFNDFKSAYNSFFKYYGFNILEQYNEKEKLHGTYLGKEYLEKILHLYNSSKDAIKDITKMQQLYKNFINFVYDNREYKKYTNYERFRAWTLINYEKYLDLHCNNTNIISNEIESLFYNITREDLLNRCGIYIDGNDTTGCTKITLDDVIKSKKKIENNYNDTNIYECKDMYAVFYIVFKKFVENSKMPLKKCANCGKYFIPQHKSDEKYCNYDYQDTGKTCREIASKNNYIENVKKNPVMMEYTRAYQKKHKQIIRNPDKIFLKNEFEEWKNEAKEKFKLFKEGKLKEKDILKWILNTK